MLQLCLKAFAVVLFVAVVAPAAGAGMEATEEMRLEAVEYARKYVEEEAAFLLGGRFTVDEYLEAVDAGLEPGEEVGVDASAVVRNAYRSVNPDIRFLAWADGPPQQDVTSSALYHYNSRPLDQDEAQPGDLLFFENGNGRIIGVGLITDMTYNSVHFITASASAGQVIETHLLFAGDYFQESVAGFGRLTYTIRP